MIITICFLSQAFLLLLLLLSQEFPLLSLLLLYSYHKHASCYGCYWHSFLFLLSHQIAIFFFVGGVSQAAARQSHECVFFCVVLRQFRQAIFLGLLWAFQEGKGKLVYEASRQASKIEQASKIKEASKQASVFLTASML